MFMWCHVFKMFRSVEFETHIQGMSLGCCNKLKYSKHQSFLFKIKKIVFVVFVGAHFELFWLLFLLNGHFFYDRTFKIVSIIDVNDDTKIDVLTGFENV